MTPLRLTRTQILAFRQAVQALDERLPHDTSSLRRAAWAGLQDSMPRAALLSIHARVEGTPSRPHGMRHHSCSSGGPATAPSSSMNAMRRFALNSAATVLR
jgi:hypothetical protein